jgi:hypothetical protein
MILRFKIRNPLLITGPKRERWDGQTRFTYKRLQCSMGLICSSPFDDSRENYSHFVEDLEFTIREDPPKNTIQSLIDTRAYQRLINIMRTIVNRCLRSIRNFGRVAGVHELPRVEDQETEELLELWHAEASVDGLNWMPIGQGSNFYRLAMGRLFGLARTGTTIEDAKLDMQRWAEIEKAIHDDLSPLPEQEFIVNASEHLHLRNFRLALVESVIGLEIVLSRYLSTYLHIHKKVPQARIEDFLSPNLTLSTRLSGLLDLTLPLDVLHQINLGNIRKAVGWRNKVVHVTGQIPDGISNSELREVISAVLDFTQRLGTLTQQLEAEA